MFCASNTAWVKYCFCDANILPLLKETRQTICDYTMPRFSRFNSPKIKHLSMLVLSWIITFCHSHISYYISPHNVRMSEISRLFTTKQSLEELTFFFIEMFLLGFNFQLNEKLSYSDFFFGILNYISLLNFLFYVIEIRISHRELNYNFQLYFKPWSAMF